MMQKALKMSDALLIERQPLGTGWAEFWTLNAPATRNALTDEMVWALRAACERAQCDTALRAVVLRGAGAVAAAAVSACEARLASSAPPPAARASTARTIRV